MDTTAKFAARFGAEILRLYEYWSSFFNGKVIFNRPDSKIHADGHCRRVLLHALIIGKDLFGNDNDALEILAQASVFHDTRRLDEGYDTGHGARAALYYKEYCREHHDMTYHNETTFLIRYHDLDDNLGIEEIRRHFGPEAPRVEKLYAIFKDADALDRPRLGPHGLDPLFLRTHKALEQIDFAKKLVEETIDHEAYAEVSREVDDIMDRFRKMLIVIDDGSTATDKTAPAEALARYIRQTEGQYYCRLTLPPAAITTLKELISKNRIVKADICLLTPSPQTLATIRTLYPTLKLRHITPPK